MQQQDTTLTFPTLGSPPRFTFPELLMNYDQGHPNHHHAPSAAVQQEHNSAFCSELSSSTSTPFVSAPSSPTSSFRAFYFSAPSSPSRAQFLLSLSQPQHYSPSTPDQSTDSSAGHALHPLNFPQTEPYHVSSSPHQTEHHHASPSSGQTTHQSSSPGHSFREDNSSGSQWRHHSLQAEHDDNSHETRVISNGAPESPQTGHQRSFFFPDQAHMYERGPDRPVSDTQHSSLTPVQVHHARSRSWWRQKKPLQADHLKGSSVSQKAFQTERVWSFHRSPASPKGKDLHTTQSHVTQDSHSIFTDFTSHTAFKRQLQVEDNDAVYSRKGFYTCAVPFSWEEKPGTPKARSVTSEVSNGEDDSPSTLLSGSSDFEFSARFPELDETPMSPTPISSTFHSFKHQYASGNPSSPTHVDVDAALQTANFEQTIRPLRLPPRLDNPVLPIQRSTRDEVNEPKHSYGSVASISAPQSPRSPRRFDIRGVLCGISSPRVDTVFDPFIAAMEKSMAENGYDLANEEMAKSPKKNEDRLYAHGHHRRTQSLSPLRVFHWDDHSAKSSSSSNRSNTDEVKNKHPIQREINARHSAGTPKRLKKWSFKGFLHRKSVSRVDSTRPSNSSASSRSSGHESCSSPGLIREEPMDVSYIAEDYVKIRGENLAMNSDSSKQASIPSTPSSILSPSSSTDSSRGKDNAHKVNKGAYAYHYGMQRAQTEELRKRTFLPYKQGLLGCLGLSSRGYRVIATLSKPLQSVS